MTEADFIAALRRLPLHDGGRGLIDDVAVVGDHVVTTDTLVESLHFLSTDPPADVAWKLVATNFSDLAAKGAAPEGVLLNYPLSESEWDRGFVAGLGCALEALGGTLIGGDTVSLPPGAPRVLTLTALGRAAATIPDRRHARPSDALWVTGTIGDAGAGLAIATRGTATSRADAALLSAYRRPVPRVAEGVAIAPRVAAMMDVSDGLLIDADRMARASGLGVTIALDRVPLSPAFEERHGAGLHARLTAATAGDDYELLFAGAADATWPAPATCVGAFHPDAGLTLTFHGEVVPLPPRLGFEHRG